MTEQHRDTRSVLDEVDDTLAVLRQGRLRDRQERERWLHESPEGWVLVEQHMASNGCDLERAMNELLAPAGEAAPGKTVAASEGMPIVDGQPLWEEVPIPNVRPRTAALADDGEDFEAKVRALTDRGITRDQAVTRLCNSGQVAF